MGADSPLVRQWIMLKMLAGYRQGKLVTELAGELDVSIKTVRRDLITLQRAGFPLEESLADFGRKLWRLDPKWQRADLTFTFDEALAMYLGRRLLEPLAGTLFWEAAQRAFRKIRAALGPAAIKYLDKIGDAFHQTLPAGGYAQKSEIIDELLRGIEDRRATFITYQSAQATEPVTYDVYPYGITFHRGSLYLIGFAPRHDELRHWKIDRVGAAEVTEVRFQFPAEFDLKRHMADSFGVYQGDGHVRVRARFDRTVARYVEESRPHASQRVTRQSDGTITADFELSSTIEIKSWLLSFGRHVEVLAPKSLRDEMQVEAKSLAAMYDSATLKARARKAPK